VAEGNGSLTHVAVIVGVTVQRHLRALCVAVVLYVRQMGAESWSPTYSKVNRDASSMVRLVHTEQLSLRVDGINETLAAGNGRRILVRLLMQKASRSRRSSLRKDEQEQLSRVV
jgi:hypothetical protein